MLAVLKHERNKTNTVINPSGTRRINSLKVPPKKFWLTRNYQESKSDQLRGDPSKKLKNALDSTAMV